MEDLIRQYCEDLKINLSYDMPVGYEDAYGTFDICCNTLFLNKRLVAEKEPCETAFFLLHELRHAQQYWQQEKFSTDIRESLPYVILYNGVCFKLQESGWKECKLYKGEFDFTDLYMSLPYELDANQYAYEQALELFPAEKKKLKGLYELFLPKIVVPMEELRRTFQTIDAKTGND